MTGKVKGFWERNKIGVCIVGGMVLSTTIAVLLTKKPAVKTIASFVTDYDVETITKFIKESAGNGMKYMIFKEAAEDVFQVVTL